MSAPALSSRGSAKLGKNGGAAGFRPEFWGDANFASGEVGLFDEDEPGFLPCLDLGSFGALLFGEGRGAGTGVSKATPSRSKGWLWLLRDHAGPDGENGGAEISASIGGTKQVFPGVDAWGSFDGESWVV